MRSIMTSGDALERDNTAGYNCAYLPIDDPKAFDEAMFILLCGTGIGFSVERQYVNKLPEVPERIFDSRSYIMVHDSKEGWAKALRQLIAMLYAGERPMWDVSEVRPAGTPLKTFGGRASGPGPLEDLFRFVIKIFKASQGRKLNSLECHDIMCKIGEVVVVGGVRRCLPEGSLVNTLKGSVAIENLKVGDEVVTGGKAYPIIAHEFSGKKSVLRINHRFGSIVCTPEHRVAYYTGLDTYEFKSAKEITVKDRLVWDSLGYEGVEEQFLPPNTEKLHFNAKAFIIPDKINEELAWLFGLIHGDGYVGLKGIEITAATHEENNLFSAKRLFSTYFGLDSTISQGHGNCLRLRVNSSSLGRWFLLHIKKPNENIPIPKFIVNATKSVRAAYLAGLFDSDGRSKEDGGIEQCTTIYKQFHKDVVHLLSTLGIGSSVYFGDTSKRRAEGVECQDFYTISITGNSNRKLWLELIAEYTATEKLGSHNFSFSGPVDFNYPVSMLKEVINTHGYKVDGNINVSSSLIPDSIYKPSPVLLIETVGEFSTYDISVAEVEQFTVDGLVVHNSALISLSNLSDDRMRVAKSGAWWEANTQRALANNSACYTERPEVGVFMQEWMALYESKSGERGMFNREAAENVVAKSGRRITGKEWGTNPCSEIILRPYQFCNLSTIVVRAEDKQEDLERKIRLASILGTFQSTLVYFPYLRKIWAENTEEERLLGVSMTGILDNALLNNPDNPELPKLLETIRDIAVQVNKAMAAAIGIPQSVAVTAIKPEGTVSQLTDSASGLHPRHSPYYYRRIRGDKKDPLTQFMIENGIPYEDDVMKPDSTVVFTFPKKAPEGALCREDMSAIQHLKLWLVYQRYYCEHKPSITVSVKEKEWPSVGAFVWEYFDEMSGVSFLPNDGGSYRQAPYEDCTEEQYLEMSRMIPKKLNWNDLVELQDNVIGSQTLACSADGCEIK